jgi:beta-RFAP synthase
MIEDPGIEVQAEMASQWDLEGPMANRAEALTRRIRGQLGSAITLPDGASMRIVSTPPEHVGLGVGTQLSLAVARLLLELGGSHNPSPETLASLAGRGRRSGIGLHGFFHGGLIVDGGRGDDAKPPPMVARVPFPDDWSILIAQPPGPRGRHGLDEVNAFSDLPPLPDRVTERLCRLVLLGILPAVVERDIETFGRALIELQHHVGSAFAPVQGGLFSSPQSASLIDELGRLGLAGAGQSSWGPTIYAFGIVSQRHRSRIAARLLDRFGLAPTSVLWTRAANHGAILEPAG